MCTQLIVDAIIKWFPTERGSSSSISQIRLVTNDEETYSHFKIALLMIVEQYNSGSNDLAGLIEEELLQQEESKQEDEFQFQEENSFQK